MVEDAGRMIAAAVKVLPGDAQIAQLSKEIGIERAHKEQASQMRFTTVITAFKALAARIDSDLSHLVIAEAPEQQRDGGKGDYNDVGDGWSHRTALRRIASEYEQLRPISESLELARLLPTDLKAAPAHAYLLRFSRAIARVVSVSAQGSLLVP